MARRSRTSPKRSPASASLVLVEVLLHDRERGVGVHGGPVEPDHPAGVLDLVHIATGDTDRDRAPGVRGDRAAEAVARLRATRADHRLVIDLLDAAEAALGAAQPVDLPRAGLAQDGLPGRPHEKVGAVVRVVEVGDVVPGTDRRPEPGTRLRLQPIEVIRGQQRPRGRRPRIRGTLRGDVGEHHDRAGVRLARQVVRRQADHDVRAAAIQVRGDVVPARRPRPPHPATRARRPRARRQKRPPGRRERDDSPSSSRVGLVLSTDTQVWDDRHETSAVIQSGSRSDGSQLGDLLAVDAPSTTTV